MVVVEEEVVEITTADGEAFCIFLLLSFFLHGKVCVYYEENDFLFFPFIQYVIFYFYCSSIVRSCFSLFIVKDFPVKMWCFMVQYKILY